MHDRRGRRAHQFEVGGKKIRSPRMLFLRVVSRAASGRIELEGRAHNVPVVPAREALAALDHRTERERLDRKSVV